MSTRKLAKLPEKASRTPDLFEVQKASIFRDYVEEVSHLGSESAKTQRFLLLLKDVFGDVNTILSIFVFKDTATVYPLHVFNGCK